MISGGTFPQKFTKIDDLTRPDHYYLTEGDACYFIGEYTAYPRFFLQHHQRSDPEFQEAYGPSWVGGVEV